MRFHRCRANDEHLGDTGFTRKEFCHANRLDGLSKSHLVGENGAPSAGGECDTIQLIRQQFGFEERAPERVRLRLDSNLSDSPGDAFQQEPAVDEFFDQVMVMAEDPKLRANRLALLAQLQGLFAGVADLSRLPG